MQDKILEDLKNAMRAGEKQKVEVLRMVKTALQMAEIDNKDDFGKDKQLKIIAKESKKRKDAAARYKTGCDEARATAELEEAVIIDEYLPQQLSDEQISQIVDKIISDSGSDNMGQVIGLAMKEVAGQADGGRVSQIVKEKLK